MWDGEGRGHTDALQALAGQCSSIPQETGSNHHVGYFGGRCQQVLCLARQGVLRQASRGRRPGFTWVTVGLVGGPGPSLSDGWARAGGPVGQVLSGSPVLTFPYPEHQRVPRS